MTEHYFTIEPASGAAHEFQPYSAEVVLGGEGLFHDLTEVILQTVGLDCDYARQFQTHRRGAAFGMRKPAAAFAMGSPAAIGGLCFPHESPLE